MMNTKHFTLITLALMTLVLAVSSASAAQCLNLQTTPPASVNHDQGTFNVPFTLTMDSGCSTNRTNLDWSVFSNIDGLTWTSAPSISELNAGQTRSGTMTFNLPADNSGNINIVVTVDTAQDDPESFSVNAIQINEEKSLVMREVVELTESQNGTIEVENNGNVALSGIQLTSAGDFTVTFSENSLTLAPGAKRTVTVAPVGLDGAGFGGETTTITARASDGTQTTLSLNVGGSFCSEGEVGGLEITSIDISNNGQGDDEEWQLLDEIEVEIDVENTGNDDIDDVMVEIGLFDSSGHNQIGDLEFDNADEEEFEIGDLDDGDEETATFTFRVPADFDEGDYKLVVKAYSDKTGEDEQCTAMSDDFETDDQYTEISVELEGDEGKFITFQDVEFTPLEGTCGETVTMSFDVFNIGDEDIEDRVKINLKNTELGVNQFYEILSDLDQGDDERVTMTFVVPQSATDKFYNLALSAEYDYRNGLYREESDDDTVIPFRVIGCGTTGGNGGNGGTGQSIAVINAALESDEAVAGEEVVVTATITSLKTDRTTFTVSASGYSSWAELDSSSTELLQLDSGENGEVTFRFLVDEDVDGTESFEIEVRDNAGNVQRRTVDINVDNNAGRPGLSLGGNSTLLWIVIIANVILVILIVIVIVRIARR